MGRSRLVVFALFVAACEPDVLQQVTPVLEVEGAAIDFGAIVEGERATGSVTLVNPVGVAVEDVTLELDAASSPDFELLTDLTYVAPGARIEVEVRFTPDGTGEDEGALWIRSAALADGPVEVTLRGGPIAPAIAVDPDPIDFGPATTATVTRTFEVLSAGDADLEITGLAIAEDGNPDFVLRAWSLPVLIPPGQRMPGAIDYVRSGRATAGRLIVTATGLEDLEVRLLPDPYRACEDGEDNDEDGLVDFPDDPGCASLTDDDESNPPECEDGLSEPCGTDVGECELGTRTCANRIWGPCEGETGPAMEICDDLDNDCDGARDEAITETCTINDCAGARACIEDSGVAGGAWSACIPVGGQSETCDGVDNDCNGIIDDGIVEQCSVNACLGTRICVPGGMGEYTACQVSTMPETCNGMDDDCNGLEDDGLQDLSCGLGVCTATAAACVGGMPGTCVPGTAGTEVCNDLDDDCNGTPDDLPNLTCGVGACTRSVPACLNGADNTCVPGTPQAEVCNGMDDDCDGTPDNGVCGTPTCGLVSTGPDPQEPNDTRFAPNPSVPAALGSRTFTYDVTLTPGDEDWFEFDFPPPGAATIATMNAQVLCADWGTSTGCMGAPAVGLAAWYFDDVCSPGGQQDGFHNGQSGLAFVTSSGSVSPFGICTPQYFRLRVFPSAAVCTGEALNAEVQVTVSFQ